MKELEMSELSDRESEILRLIATGASNKEIAQKLVISPNTVKVHLRNIFEKIGVVSRTEAALYAINIGLVAVREARAVEISDAQVTPDLSPNENSLSGSLSTQTPPPTTKGFYQRWPIVVGALLIGIIIFLTAWQFRSGLPNASNNEPNNTSPQTTESRWNRLADLPLGRSEFAVAIYENKIYTFGGQVSDGLTAEVQIFNPLSNSWGSGAAKPLAVSNFQAAVIGGVIIAPGGQTLEGKPTDRVEVYDPIRNIWEQRNSLPAPLSNYALATIEGRVFLFGGWNGSEVVDVMLEYDPETDQWINFGVLQSPRMHAGAAAVGGNIYLIGGNDGNKDISANEIFYPQRDAGQGSSWEPRLPLPKACGIAGITVVADSIFTLCNDDDGSLFAYSPVTNTWQAFLESKPAGLANRSQLVFLGNYLFYLGGKDLSGLPSAASWSNQIFYTLLIPYVNKEATSP